MHYRTAEALVEQLIEKGKASLAKEQALPDLLTRDGEPKASDEGIQQFR